jgi:hypothetical protein
MSARRPQTPEGKALHAFVAGRITRVEFKRVCKGDLLIRGGWLVRPIAGRGGMRLIRRFLP